MIPSFDRTRHGMFKHTHPNEGNLDLKKKDGKKNLNYKRKKFKREGKNIAGKRWQNFDKKFIFKNFLYKKIN